MRSRGEDSVIRRSAVDSIGRASSKPSTPAPTPAFRLPSAMDSTHIRPMPKPPKKPKLSTGKATKPELKPLDTYLAELLNPAINREHERFPEAPAGFAERPQETYAHGEVTDVDPALAEKLGLKGPED